MPKKSPNTFGLLLLEPETITKLTPIIASSNIKNRSIPDQFIGKKFSELFNYFYNEKQEICIGTFYEEENMSITEFLSSDPSALDKFIEKKLSDYGHSFEEKNKLNVDINPDKNTIISKGQGALIVK